MYNMMVNNLLIVFHEAFCSLLEVKEAMALPGHFKSYPGIPAF